MPVPSNVRSKSPAQNTIPENEHIQPSTRSKLLVVSPFHEDHVSLRAMFDEKRWRVQQARCYREGLSILCADRIPVILCEVNLPDGNWRDVLSQTSALVDPPRLVVMSLNADEGLWAEVLNMGAFDLLMKPLDRDEVTRVVQLAWQNWRDESERKKRSWGHLTMTASADF